MTTIVTRAGKGSALTHNEVDTNFTNLNSAKYESGNNATFGTIGATTITGTSFSTSGNLNFTGTSNRITGDFSNGTASNRVSFQSSTTNGATVVQLLPNGTGTQSNYLLFNSNTPDTNFSALNMFIAATESTFRSIAGGTGTFLPMTFHTGGSERMRIDTSGNVGIGTSSPSRKLDVSGSSAAQIEAVVNNTQSTTSGSIISTGTSFSYAQVGGSTSWFYGNKTVALGNDTNNPIQFITNANERMRIDSSGNVGIGTSSPTNAGAGFKFVTTSGSTSAQYQAYGGSGTDARLFAENGYGATGMFSNHPFLFYTNSSERMRIESSGNVGIGTSSPNRRLDVVDASRAPASEVGSFGVGATSAQQIRIGYDTTGFGWIQPANFGVAVSNLSLMPRGGNLLVGTTSQIGFGQTSISFNQASNWGMAIQNTSGTSTSAFIAFVNSSGSTQGTIAQTNSTTTAYNTSSDYRLKENIVPMTSALETVAQLKPVTYKWKVDGSDGQGFIAHELQAVIPDAVTGEKDAVDKDGKPVYQGVDTSFLVATLTAAIQELSAKVDTLQAELNTLKGN